ncbi:MAG: hypothetical protein IPJ31_11875 [Bacteroidetes bacterium]|nr:hypothetical protein [Bacteroidota bacterium]MBP6316178.1 hypothetical protein [Chitinophagaceae bacterium]
MVTVRETAINNSLRYSGFASAGLENTKDSSLTKVEESNAAQQTTRGTPSSLQRLTIRHCTRMLPLNPTEYCDRKRSEIRIMKTFTDTRPDDLQSQAIPFEL